MKKTIVMNVCAKHPPFDGRVYEKISKTLVKCGYEVHNSSPNIESQFTKDGIYLHGFPQGKGMARRIKSLLLLRKLVEEVHPDCMICHEPDALFTAYKYYKAEKKNRSLKLYFDCHEAYEHWFDNATGMKCINRAVGKLLMTMINGVVKRIDGVTSVNNTMTERFKKYNSNSYFLPSVYKIDGTDDYHSNQSASLVYMGQFGKSKQAEIFTGAAKILKDKGIQFKITVIGGNKTGDNNPNSFERIVEREHLEEYFECRGWMPREEAFNELRKYGIGIMRFDSYTMPGNYAMPNKLFEYMSFGLAILSCSLNLEIKNIIEQEKCGILMENETAEELAKAIEYIINHHKEIETMKRNAYLATVKTYNWQNYEGLFKQIIDG